MYLPCYGGTEIQTYNLAPVSLCKRYFGFLDYRNSRSNHMAVPVWDIKAHL